jgi:hypothetical protein
MIRGWLALTLLGAALPSAAAPWEFGAPFDVAGAPRPGVFHHLDAGSRQHLSISGDTVALVWEDNRSGSAQVHGAFKSLKASRFSPPQRFSTGTSASEPVIAALGGERFLVAWEQDGAVWARTAAPTGLGAPRKLADNAMHISLGTDTTRRLYAAWSERRHALAHIRVARLVLDDAGGVRADTSRQVETETPVADQLYPSIALTAQGGLIAWEDRRHGHTLLLYSMLSGDSTFTVPQILNEQPARMQVVYGKGMGVARVGLSRYGQDAVAAVWLDKRDFLSGYDVYAAMSRVGGRSFGANQKVQDDFGSNIAQWHAAIAGNHRGDLVAVWDDDRDDTSDVWLSWRTDSGWSENYAIPVASGPGQQVSPALAFDTRGDLHLAWLEREFPEAPTRLRYAWGRRAGAGAKPAAPAP